ncbi:MAG: cell division protein FtsZ [Bacteroides sp.]|nr:cell division protein FtsZ [Bacillota bacterium]MCM1394445.1 cell division protein FtsZ [[Eubacterium] siraeum]MCM1455895.1 cell division protein FtsZ [Bacteroides sp.]
MFFEQYTPDNDQVSDKEQSQDYIESDGAQTAEEIVASVLSDSIEEPVTQKIDGHANIVVVGVGGGGCNAVNNMVRAGIKSANFVVMNTDVQALNMSSVPRSCKIQLGSETTRGLGAGSDPDVGKRAAEESRNRIKTALKGIDLLFITAGMGGGTGTGAAPVIAEIARSMGILTVAVVTKPFAFEGARRMKNAEQGIKNLKDFVDTLLVIPNQKLVECFKDQKITFKRAFEIADDVLRQGVQGVSDVIANPELVNLDFADVRAILKNKGLAHMGVGYGKGEMRIVEAVKGAISNPLLEVSIEGATGVIINIVGGDDLMLGEVSDACAMIRDVIDPDANLIFGMSNVPKKQDVEITIIATGFVDKRYIPAKIAGSAPTHRTQSLDTALAAADFQSAPVQEQPKQFPTAYPTRPVFQTRQPQQSQPVQPQQTYQPPQQSTQPKTSRIDVPGYNVPHFLRRLRGENNDDNKQ